MHYKKEEKKKVRVYTTRIFPIGKKGIKRNYGITQEMILEYVGGKRKEGKGDKVLLRGVEVGKDNGNTYMTDINTPPFIYLVLITTL